MKRILVVDDLEQNLYMLKALLAGHGYGVETATNGAEALDRAKEKAPDLVISDILMPVMDGFSLCREWKKDSKLKSVPFIFYTATYTDPKDEEFALSLGADRFVVKPIEPDEFLGIVREVMASFEKGELAARPPEKVPDEEVFQKYNKILIQKLEKKMLDLEETRETLKKQVAELEQTRLVLHDEKEKMHLLLDTLPHGVQENDLNGTITFSNTAHARMHGYKPEEITGKKIWDFAATAAAKKKLKEYLKFLVAEQPKPTPYISVDKTRDGKKITLQVDWDYLRSTGGELIAFISVITDISKRVEAEEALRRANRELEERVEERTTKLRQAYQELEAFAYSVSHDLRAPLRAINGFSQILMDRHISKLDEKGQHYFNNILKASEHMDRLIQDLLTYSRLGRSAVRRESVSLNEILQAVEVEMRKNIRESGAQITIEKPLPTLEGSDSTLVKQIFVNFLSNALMYCYPDVPPEIHIGSKTEADWVTISVADNGIGIEPEYLEKIFNVFQRLHGQERYPGTGIGLAIVKKSVELLGGSVWVESASGKGSTFFVRLPARSKSGE